MQIQVVKKQELYIIQKLAQTIWPVAYANIISTEQIQYMLDKIYNIKSLEQQLNNNQVFLLIKNNNKLLAFAAYQPNYQPNTTKLHKLYVLPEAQKKGVGKAIIQYVCQKAQQANNTTLQLNVNQNNTKAIFFYQNQGFINVKPEIIPIGNTYVMQDYVYQKQINYNQ